MSTSPQLSQAILADQMTILRAELGESVHRAAISKLEPADREALNGLAAMGWCDINLAKRYKDSVADEVGKSSLELQRWIVKLAVGRTVGGFWRVLLSQVWDDALVKRVPILYQRTFDVGVMSAKFDGAGSATMTVTGWPRIPEYDLVGLQVGVESILQLLGREGASAQASRTPDGVVYKVRWKTK